MTTPPPVDSGRQPPLQAIETDKDTVRTSLTWKQRGIHSFGRGVSYSKLFNIFIVFRCFHMLLGVENRNLLFKFFFLLIWPQLPEVWKIPKRHYNPKNENIPMGVLDSSNEATGCTDNNAKNLNSLWCTVAEKSRKTPKLTICQKMDQLFLLCHVHCSLDLVYPKGYNAVFYTVLLIS